MANRSVWDRCKLVDVDTTDLPDGFVFRTKSKNIYYRFVRDSQEKNEHFGRHDVIKPTAGPGRLVRCKDLGLPIIERNEYQVTQGAKTLLIGSTTEFVLNKIVAVERGRWNQTMEDWNAVIVLEGNVRIETDELSARALVTINRALGGNFDASIFGEEST